LGLFLGHTVIATPLVIVMVRAGPDNDPRWSSWRAAWAQISGGRSMRDAALDQATIVAAAAFTFQIRLTTWSRTVAVPIRPRCRKVWETIRFEIDPTLTAIASLLTLVAAIVLVGVELMRRGSSDRAE
jgi:putative spermidine/putrescine transport system permease protein